MKNSKAWSLFLFGIFVPWFSYGEPWVNFYGSHYKNAPWAESIRDPVKPRYLFEPLSDKTLSVIENVSKNKHLIYGVEGLGSGRNQQHVSYFLNRMLLDYGEAWKNEITHNALSILAQEDSIPNQVVWQFGNEINSRRFNETVFEWAGSSRIKAHNTDVIPYYVEYYLAPGVEALRNAEQMHKKKAPKAVKKSPTRTAESDKIRVALGSIAVAAQPRSQAFLDALLSYRVKGLCAPSLKGVQVTELVDIVTLHYIVSANRPIWRQALDSIKQKWYQKGRIQAIWSTEEIGIERAEANVGGVFAIQVMARYMDWWLEQGFNSDQGRAFFWGTGDGDPGHRAKEALQDMVEWIGADAELALQPPNFLEVEGKNIEAYGFNIKGSQQKLVFVFPKDQRQDAKITHWQWAKDVRLDETRMFSELAPSKLASTWVSPEFKQGKVVHTLEMPKSTIWVGLFSNQ